MTQLVYAALALAASLAPGLEAGSAAAQVVVGQLTIQQRAMIRVPSAAPLTQAPPRPIRWRERRRIDCIAMTMLSGAAVAQPDTVDLYLRGGQRVRARLDDECPALDYYSGFYIAPTKDGRICARRDTIRTRSGGSCAIERFRVLAPAR